MSDLISRQAAIDAIEEYADRLQMVDWKENPAIPYKAHTLNWCINTIRDLPSAQPEQQWIPCSERLPEEDASVLASIKNHSFEVAVGEIDGEVFWIVDGFIPLDDVIAWMPLPEPYKEENNG